VPGVHLFDPDGNFLDSWGSDITTGAHRMFYNREEVGKFSSPRDLHVDGAGNIYVVEWLDHGTGKRAKLARVVG
jgi:hypothetical protein